MLKAASRFTAPLLAATALLTACATAPATRPHEGPVALGQTAYAGGPTARPVKVIEDSRCPANARCIWAGRVVVRTIVTTGRGSNPIDLILGEPVQVADGKLALVSVTPERYTDKPLAQRDYRFTFDFQGGL